jgi:putative transposase
MDDCESLQHTRWECKYHVVFIPKCRRKKLCAQLHQHLGEAFRELAQQRESQILERHMVVDRVHMLISIPAPAAPNQSAWSGSHSKPPALLEVLDFYADRAL